MTDVATELLFEVTDLKQWSYCPRVLFYRSCLPEIRPVTDLMAAGIRSHGDEAGREERRSLRMYGLTLDMTSFQQAQQERAALQQELADQGQRLLELSAPLIPVSEDVLVMPLIGSLDPARAQHAMETLLAGVRQHRARFVLVDLTGVAVVDARGAAALHKMTTAVQLLGGRIVLTGMRTEIGRALVALDSELSGVATCASLREAIAQLVSERVAPRRTAAR